MTTDNDETASYRGVGDRVGTRHRRSIGQGASRRILRAVPVDFHCHPIRPGNIVTVPKAEWSRGTAKWMEQAHGTVVSVARTRVEVHFHGLTHTNFVPARSVSIITDDEAV